MCKLKKQFLFRQCSYDVRDERELDQFMQDYVRVMNLAKLNLKGWGCGYHETPHLTSSAAHVLGMLWNRQVDTLNIALNCSKTETWM